MHLIAIKDAIGPSVSDDREELEEEWGYNFSSRLIFAINKKHTTRNLLSGNLAAIGHTNRRAKTTRAELNKRKITEVELFEYLLKRCITQRPQRQRCIIGS